MAIEVSTSILQVNKNDIIKVIYNLETAHTDYFHIDVMDGEFVKNDTTDLMREYSEYIKQISNIPLDVHLMVNDVKSYIISYGSFEPNIITFHLEACKDKTEVKNMIELIKNNNSKVGIAIKPNTPIEDVFEFLPYIHMCLVMTVEPGKGGQDFILECIEKIDKLKKYIIKNNLDIDIEVDGGINDKTASKVSNSGANILVSRKLYIKFRQFFFKNF